MTLDSLREESRVITESIIDLLVKRKLVVDQIQVAKKTSGQPLNKNEFKNFDPQREFVLFESLAHKLKKLSYKELLILSLMIESHASGVEEKAYPAWSELVHLETNTITLNSQINPILLATLHKDSYDALPLNDKFKEIINPLLESK